MKNTTENETKTYIINRLKRRAYYILKKWQQYNNDW